MRNSIVVACLSALFFVGLPTSLMAGSCGAISEPMTQKAILERISPVGEVDVDGTVATTEEAAPVALAANAGELRYKASCAVCHAAGVAGAPKFRDKAQWESRMAAGIDAMLKIAITGKGAMPPKGTCMQCSDEELRMAIEYMLPQ